MIQSYEKLIEKNRQHLLIEDTTPIDVAIATYLANHFNSDPLWLLIIAPPSSAKTEIINSFSLLEDVYPLSDLTEKTFASGWAQCKASLLPKLSGKILAMKDFTTVICMRSEKRAEILGQLREIYDGSYHKDFGTGHSIDWKGKIGFMAGVTPAIDQHYAIFQTLGERFIQIRMQPVDELQMARMSMRSSGTEQSFRKEISELMMECCKELVGHCDKMPSISSEIEEKLASLASLCVRARSSTDRNRYSRTIEYIPQPEAPARFAKQLCLLSRGLAALRGASAVGDQDFQIVNRVGTDCLPIVRSRIINGLAKNGALSADGVVKNLGISKAAAYRQMEDMTALEILIKVGDAWKFTDRVKEQLRTIVSPLSTTG